MTAPSSVPDHWLNHFLAEYLKHWCVHQPPEYEQSVLGSLIGNPFRWPNYALELQSIRWGERDYVKHDVVSYSGTPVLLRTHSFRMDPERSSWLGSVLGFRRSAIHHRLGYVHVETRHTTYHPDQAIDGFTYRGIGAGDVWNLRWLEVICHGNNDSTPRFLYERRDPLEMLALVQKEGWRSVVAYEYLTHTPIR